MNKNFSDVSRYELKYTITEAVAGEIRDYLKNICTLDKHVPRGETGYTVNNLYFDTPDLKFYYDTKFRKPTRYKPRARFYGEKAEDTIWPEIKYRHDSVIWKRRYPIPIKHWPDLFDPGKLSREHTLVKEQLDSFDDLIYWFGARSVLHVRYFREPYVTELDDYGRVTLDRNLCCRPTYGCIDPFYHEQDMRFYDDPVTIRDFDSLVILEIKVLTMLPEWAMALIRKFNLTQRGFSKYCYGMDISTGLEDSGRISKLEFE